MYRIALTLAAVALAGCANTGEWRALNIDGSNEAAFGESLARLNNELPPVRGELLALALVDIANTRAESTGQTNGGVPAYSDAEFRRELNGLTYDGVLALADQSGPPIKTLYYYSRGWGSAQSEVNRLMSVPDRPYMPSPPMFQDTHSGYVWPNN